MTRRRLFCFIYLPFSQALTTALMAPLFGNPPVLAALLGFILGTAEGLVVFSWLLIRDGRRRS